MAFKTGDRVVYKDSLFCEVFFIMYDASQSSYLYDITVENTTMTIRNVYEHELSYVKPPKTTEMADLKHGWVKYDANTKSFKVENN